MRYILFITLRINKTHQLVEHIDVKLHHKRYSFEQFDEF